MDRGRNGKCDTSKSIEERFDQDIAIGTTENDSAGIARIALRNLANLSHHLFLDRIVTVLKCVLLSSNMSPEASRQH